MVLGFAEIRQHIIPAPAGIAELVPMVVICRLPAHVDHAVASHDVTRSYN